MPPSQPNARAGPSSQRANAQGPNGASSSGGNSGGGGGARGKVIRSTVDLLRQNQAAKAAGKGKHKAVLGDLDAFTQVSSNLPGALQVERFAEARALEILALQNAVKVAAANNTSRAFQSLPRHLRRRAASHNPRRVPKRIRGRAAAEIDPSDPTVRLHRKKAKLLARGNLRGESRTAQLRKRQRSKSWLATHLFHAKRFHMTNLWGYRLPLTPTLKSFRPALRSARRRVTLHDASYLKTITVRGKRDDVVKSLSMTSVGTFAGSKYESGSRAAQVVMYHPEAFPRGLIGPAQVIWDRTGGVLLRVHPAIASECLSALQACTSVRVEVMQHDVGAFEVIGPWAGRVIRRVLRQCREDPAKTDLFRNLAQVSPDEVPDSLIAGLLVYDPRLHFPPPRLPDVPRTNDEEIYASPHLTPSSALASSTLWDDKVRITATPSFKKSDLDRRRHQLGMPGTRLRPLAQDDRFPVVIVKRSIVSDPTTQGFNGYNLLFPSAWSMALLNSFVYAGAFLTGLEEWRVLHREAGVPSFPEHYGDVCAAGREWEEQKGEERRRRWERKPPGKRAEFASLGTDAPFIPNWSTILENGTSAEERGMNGDQTVEPWLFTSPLTQHLSALRSSADPSKTILSMTNAFRSQRGMTKLSPTEAHRLFSEAVIHVRVEVLGRGSPSDMAVIYAIRATERQAWVDANEVSERDPLYGISEVQRLGEAPVDRDAAIGYVSTGNFSFSRGRGHALGTITLKAYMELLDFACESERLSTCALVKVRNIDGHLCRLASVIPI